MAEPASLPGVLDAHRQDHLILLVGSNPLPNAVAGRLLAKDGGRISLLYTPESQHVKDHLMADLERACPTATRNDVKLDSGTAPRHICQKVEEVVRAGFEELPAEHTVGLHYTGGTKAMSVHAYRTLERLVTDPRRLQFSYLDAQRLQLIVEPGAGLPHREKVGAELRVRISLEELMALHGWGFYARGTASPPLAGTARALLAEVPRCETAYMNWKGWALDKRALHLPDPSHLNDRVKDYFDRKGWNYGASTRQRVQAFGSALSEALRRDLSLPASESSVPVSVLAGPGKLFKSAKKLGTWLDGSWLETPVADALASLATRFALHDIRVGIEPTVKATADPLPFELDVVALRGYQLFVFSCTTAGKSEGSRSAAKKRLFEAYVRARQLGGDEARVALVSTVEETGTMKREIFQSFDTSGQIEVFGQNELQDLEGVIGTWIAESVKMQAQSPVDAGNAPML